MKKGEFYKSLAWCYDFITTGKGHKKEADFIKRMVKKYKKSKGNELLNVACGHGWHDKFLKKTFKVTGLDYSKTILKIAKKRNPRVRYLQGDMRKFDLKRRFDVVMSFDSMMYNLNYKDLRNTIKNLAKHLVDGGVLIFHLDKLKDNFVNQYGNIGCEEHFKNDIRMIFSQLDYDKNPNDTVFESCLTFLISRKGKDVEVITNKEKMGLFELAKIKKILSDLGFRTYLYSGDDFSGKRYSKKSDFPIFVCVR